MTTLLGIGTILVLGGIILYFFAQYMIELCDKKIERNNKLIDSFNKAKQRENIHGK